MKEPKQVPCPWDPNATCPESPSRSITFKQYPGFMIVSWWVKGEMGSRTIEDKDTIRFIEENIFEGVLPIVPVIGWTCKGCPHLDEKGGCCAPEEPDETMKCWADEMIFKHTKNERGQEHDRI